MKVRSRVRKKMMRSRMKLTIWKRKAWITPKLKRLRR